MTEIKAYIRETKFEQVVRALEAAGVKRLTAVRTMPVWTDVEPEFVDISTAQPSAHYAPVVKIELVCREQDADRYAAIIADQARTGRPGDGSIFCPRSMPRCKFGRDGRMTRLSKQEQ